MKTLTLNISLLVGVLILIAALVLTQQASPVLGSAPRGSEYQGTTTTQGAYLADSALLTTSGTLGSVVITGAAAGVINIYDATTSDITKRQANMSSSSILVATIPASAAAGTYTFDRVVFNGLYVNIIGTIPTSTITFRQ